jgi:plasmid maintenance system antidote protein VapI
MAGDTPLRLAHFFGMSAEFWLKLSEFPLNRVGTIKHKTKPPVYSPGGGI